MQPRQHRYQANAQRLGVVQLPLYARLHGWRGMGRGDLREGLQQGEVDGLSHLPPQHPPQFQRVSWTVSHFYRCFSFLCDKKSRRKAGGVATYQSRRRSGGRSLTACQVNGAGNPHTQTRRQPD